MTDYPDNVLEALERFDDLVFSEPDSARKLDWIHARVRGTCRPVAPPQAVIDEWERDLDHARRTDFAEMAASRGCAVEEIIEEQRPKPSLEWRPLFCSSRKNQVPDDSDCVFLLAVLHDSIGPYRETPMKPRLAADGDDFIVSLRWEAALGGLPRPEDRIQDREPPRWFVPNVSPRIGGWFKQFQEAFTREFGGAERPAGGGSAGAAGQTLDVVPAVSPEQPFGGGDVTKQPSNDANFAAKRPSDRTQSGHSRKKIKPRKRKTQSLLAHFNKNKSRLAKGVPEIEIVREFCRQKEIPIAKATNLARNLRRYKKAANPDT